MSVVFVALMALGLLANVIGALCIIVPCVTWLGFMAWALTRAD